MKTIGSQYIRNVYSTWLVYAVRLLITFLFVPYITSVLGGSRYGVWVIIFQTIGYFTLLDVGLTSSITRYVSKFLSLPDYGRINRVLNTSGVLYLIIGSAVLAGVYLFVSFFFQYFQVDDPLLASEGRTALMIMGCFLALNFYLLPFGNSLGAFHRYDIAGALGLGEEILRVGAWVWLLSQGYGLVSLAATLTVFSVLRHLVGIMILKRLHPEIRLSYRQADRESARMLLKYSRTTFGIVAAALVIFNTDSVLLGLMMSSTAAGVYHPGAQLLSHLRNIVNAVGTPLIPAISDIDTRSDRARIRSLYFKGLKYTSYLSFLICTGVFVFARDFVDLWLPPSFGDAATVMMILAVGATVFLPQIIGNSVLYGIGKHRYIMWVLVAEAAVKLPLAIFLIERYGLTGLAVAGAAPQFVLYLTLYPVLISRALETGVGRVLRQTLSYGITAAALTAAASYLSRRLLPPVTWTTFVIDVFAVVLIGLLVGFFILDPEDRQRLLGDRPES